MHTGDHLFHGINQANWLDGRRHTICVCAGLRRREVAVLEMEQQCHDNTYKDADLLRGGREVAQTYRIDRHNRLLL